MDSYSSLKRLALKAQLTVCGIFIIPLIDLLMKFKTIVVVLLIPFRSCQKKKEFIGNKVRDFISLKILQISEMNDYEM